MRWSFKIARIAGTEIRIHLTLLILLIWIGVSAGSQGTPLDGVVVVTLICLVFGCVLLHELGHVFVALHFGITTPRIVLYPIGGVAWMKKIPRDPRQEFLIAIAGPAVNFFLAAVVFLATGASIPVTVADANLSFQAIPSALLWINLVLGIFNLIPAFPMDGGRIFRAFVAMWLPYEKATAIAVRVGEIFGIGIAVFSIYQGQPILLLISLFVIFSASAEGASVKREQLLEGLTASDASMSEFHTLQLQDTIHHAVTLILDGPQPDFPVVNPSGQCVAIATRNDIIRALRDQGPGAFVSEAASEIPPQIDRDTPASEALRQLVSSGLPGAAVIDERGLLVQWLTMENLDDLLQTRAATHDFVTEPPPT